MKTPMLLLAALFCCAANVSAAEEKTAHATVYANPRFELNMRESSAQLAVDNAVKSAMTKKIGEIRKRNAGSSLQSRKLTAEHAEYIVKRSGRKSLFLRIDVESAEIVSNEGQLPKTQKTVKFNLKSADRTSDESSVQSDVAQEFIQRNSPYFDCEGSHIHGEGRGSRRYCVDVVDTTRKIVKVDMTIRLSEFDD